MIKNIWNSARFMEKGIFVAASIALIYHMFIDFSLVGLLVTGYVLLDTWGDINYRNEIEFLEAKNSILEALLENIGVHTDFEKVE